MCENNEALRQLNEEWQVAYDELRSLWEQALADNKKLLEALASYASRLAAGVEEQRAAMEATTLADAKARQRGENIDGSVRRETFEQRSTPEELARLLAIADGLEPDDVGGFWPDGGWGPQDAIICPEGKPAWTYFVEKAEVILHAGYGKVTNE